MNNRKPDVLPVEGASIAEALEALRALCEYVPGAEGIPEGAQTAADRIRSALYRAAAKGKAWRAAAQPTAVCGEGRTADGCGAAVPHTPAWKGDDNIAYRCLDCAVVFCKWCLRKHFEASLPAPPKGSTP